MLKTPVVPLFWMESSDHDLAEVNHIYFPGAQKAEKFTYGISENPHQQSVGSMILGEDFADYIRQVQRTLPQNDFYDAVTRLMSECYYPGTTYGEAFGKMMSRLFGRWGLIFVDSESVDLKRLATPIIVRKIAEKGRVNELLQEQSAELESENYGRQIQIRAHLLNVYIMRDNIRIPLTLLGEMLTNGDERVVLNDEALMKLAQEHPEFFSPKVALRPIIQDFLFPTVAYIGGPSELAYFAQLKKIYEFFDIQMPIIWPRASATLVGGKVKYHIQRLDIKLEDVFRDPDELFKNLVNHTDYQSPEKTFEAAEISLQQLIDWLNDNLSKIDSTLPHQFSVSYKKMQYQLQSMKSKTFNQLNV
jgi:bacillithiol biosynthesis cysteine-adding enzyme BshC